MIIVRHAKECSSKPDARGHLTGRCNCKTAKLDERARKQLMKLLGTFAGDSIKAGEESEYFALRLDELAEQIRKNAHSVRMTAKRSDRTTRITTVHKKARGRERMALAAVAPNAEEGDW